MSDLKSVPLKAPGRGRGILDEESLPASTSGR